jgi:hypothetical protein
MTQLTCDAVDELDDDDEFEDMPLPRPRAWTKIDGLTPAPPEGWLMVLDLVTPQHGLAIGCWICTLQHLEVEEFKIGCLIYTLWRFEKQERRRAQILLLAQTQILHTICRDQLHDRVLVVHPILKWFATSIVSDLNSILTQCNCGGSDCLAGDMQNAALRVLAKRAWKKMSIPEKIRRLQNNWMDEPIGLSIALAGPAVLSSADLGTTFLEEIIASAYSRIR